MLYEVITEEVRRYRADFPPGGLEKALLEGGIDAQEWREETRRSILYRKASETIARPLAEVSEQEVRRAYRDTYGNARRPERVITSYSIHYTKLYDAPSSART